MTLELEDEELPPLEQQTPLWILPADHVESPWAIQGALPLLQMPVGTHQEGNWEQDWAELGHALQTWAVARRRVALRLEGVCSSRMSGLVRSSVRQLLQLGAPRLHAAAAMVLVSSAVEAVLEAGDWDAQQLAIWSEWASVLPDDCVPIVAIDMRSLSASMALHLASSSQIGSLQLALRMPIELESLPGEVHWLGWNTVTGKGTLWEQQISHQELLEKIQGDSRPAQVGLVVPMDRLRSAADCETLLQAWRDCQARGWRVRLLREEEIHQAWHGLEALVVLGDRISGKGRRQLAGFFAAGGAILWLRQATGMVEECPFEGCQEFPRVE